MTTCDLAIIGAGPYGLSLAAHLRACGSDFRIFGSPMHTWLTQMPKGMFLKSEGFASFLYDPGSTFTLAHYCKQEGLPYADEGIPVPLDTFAAYGIAFQRKFVPDLENKQVLLVRRSPGGFQLLLSDGEQFVVRRLVMATGIGYFGFVPPVLAGLPGELVTHSSQHRIADCFKGRSVTVVGAGASALDLAALLHQSGASVHVVARKPVIRFHDPPETTPRSLWQRVRHPITGLGSGWKLVFFANAPQAFRYLPEHTRLDAVRRTLGPAPGWFVKDQVVGKVAFHLGVTITHASVHGSGVSLDLTDNSGTRHTHTADHVIAATGYKVDLRRLPFLDSGLRERIRCVEQSPVLSANFECSVPGLYFVGTAAANTFGPLMRFAYGAGFTSRRLSSHLAKSIARRFVQNDAMPELEALERS
jgi:thioredoxin reductase